MSRILPLASSAPARLLTAGPARYRIFLRQPYKNLTFKVPVPPDGQA
jgi:hypothetical protein